MIALKSQYAADEVELQDNCALVRTKIALINNHAMYIGGFYNNNGPSCNVELLECSQIATNTKNNRKAFMNLGGDFNALGIDWESRFTTPECWNKESREKLINTSLTLSKCNNNLPGRSLLCFFIARTNQGSQNRETLYLAYLTIVP